jgi:hypothetical protein
VSRTAASCARHHQADHRAVHRMDADHLAYRELIGT